MIEQDLTILTGMSAAGRLSGTAGALLAARYLAGALRRAGFEPAGSLGYLDPLPVRAARLTGPVRVQVGERTLRHREEFGEVAALSLGGQANGPLRVLRDDEALDPALLNGAVALIPDPPAGFDLGATAAAAADLGVGALLVEGGGPAWFHKTVYAGAGRLPVLRVRRSVAAELVGLAGQTAQVDLPLEAATRVCHNLLGLRRAVRPGAPTLLWTAHYDHLGDDPGGHRFPGAEDNASGVAVLLEAARRLGHRKDMNLLVAFTTGEESGLYGARHLAAHLPLPVDAAINLDGAGIEPGLHALRLGHSAPGHWLADLAAATMERRSIQPRWITGRDDSAALLAAGLPTLGLGQERTKPAQGRMHTPADRPEALHRETLLDTAELLVDLTHIIGRHVRERSAIHV